VKFAGAWILIAIVVLALVDAVMIPGFFRLELKDGHLYGSLVDILHHSAPTMLVALGMTLVIATGGVDLSVGAVLAIVGTVAAGMVTRGVGIGPTLVWALVWALGLGLVNGGLVAFGKVQPIIATLILMVAGRGIAQLLSDGQIITFTDPSLSYFGSGHIASVPFSWFMVGGVWLALTLLVRRTALGLFIESVGDNPVAARISGINVVGVLGTVYAVVAVCAGLAGLLVVAETRAADANNAGLYIELDAILSVVLGGTSLTGGRFSLGGSLLGAIFIQALTTTILTKGVQVEWTLVVKAVVVLAVCLLQSPAWRTRFTKRVTA
jgi:simple sugar transport system permease protein